jgi:hypothetical protein
VAMRAETETALRAVVSERYGEIRGDTGISVGYKVACRAMLSVAEECGEKGHLHLLFTGLSGSRALVGLRLQRRGCSVPLIPYLTRLRRGEIPFA